MVISSVVNEVTVTSVSDAGGGAGAAVVTGAAVGTCGWPSEYSETAMAELAGAGGARAAEAAPKRAAVAME